MHRTGGRRSLRFTNGAVVTAVRLQHLAAVTKPDSWRQEDGASWKDDIWAEHCPSHTSCCLQLLAISTNEKDTLADYSRCPKEPKKLIPDPLATRILNQGYWTITTYLQIGLGWRWVVFWQFPLEFVSGRPASLPSHIAACLSMTAETMIQIWENVLKTTAGRGFFFMLFFLSEYLFAWCCYRGENGFPICPGEHCKAGVKHQQIRHCTEKSENNLRYYTNWSTNLGKTTILYLFPTCWLLWLQRKERKEKWKLCFGGSYCATKIIS